MPQMMPLMWTLYLYLLMSIFIFYTMNYFNSNPKIINKKINNMKNLWVW